jgi:hypothetical protein
VDSFASFDTDKFGRLAILFDGVVGFIIIIIIDTQNGDVLVAGRIASTNE